MPKKPKYEYYLYKYEDAEDKIHFEIPLAQQKEYLNIIIVAQEFEIQ